MLDGRNDVLDRFSLSRRQLVIWVGLLILVALPPIAQAIGDPFLIKLVTRMLIYGLAAAALDLIVGYGALVSLGHGAFFGIGAYTVGVLAMHSFEDTPISWLTGDWTGTTSALVQWPLAIAIGAGVALVIGALCVRAAGVYFIMITLAFAQMLYFVMISQTAYGGEDGLNIWERSTLPGIDLSNATTFYYVCLALLVTFIVLADRVLKSRFGQVVQAIRQNETRTTALGISPYPFKLTAFVISAAGTALAGALIAHHNEFAGPGLMRWTVSGELLVMVILGGMGTLIGPVIGAIALLTLEEVLTSFTEHWMLILGPVLILFVLFLKRGLWGVLVGPDRPNE
ncbi:MAG: branched-chain amino acid ABC transporter permease [Pseudomonadota bacterium]